MSAIKYEVKEQKAGFISMLLGILGASFFRKAITGKSTIRACEGTIKAGHDFQYCLIL